MKKARIITPRYVEFVGNDRDRSIIVNTFSTDSDWIKRHVVRVGSFKYNNHTVIIGRGHFNIEIPGIFCFNLLFDKSMYMLNEKSFSHIFDATQLYGFCRTYRIFEYHHGQM